MQNRPKGETGNLDDDLAYSMRSNEGRGCSNRHAVGDGSECGGSPERSSGSGKGSRPVRILKVAIASLLANIALTAAAMMLGVGEESLGAGAFAARFALILSVLLLVCAFRPSSRLYRTEVDWKDRRHLAAVLAIPIIVSLVLIPFSNLTNQREWLSNTGMNELYGMVDGNIYNHLTDSLLEGRVTLDLPHSDILDSLENPYVWADRIDANADAQEPIYWDYAYYQGKYYCYFGVLPCILTFLPYKAITGMDLGTDHVVVLFSILAIWSLLPLLENMRKKLFPKVSLGAFLIALMMAVAACGIFEQAFVPRVYEVPTTSGFMFCCLSLACWFRAKPDRDGSLSKGMLVLGAVLMGCTIGCRPQFTLAVVLALPIFWPEIRKRLFFSKKGLLNTACVIAPIIVVVIPFMLYNYVRFGSPTDFGAMYNITGADMTAFEYPGVRRSLGYVLQYFFMPFVPADGFPFITVVNDLNVWELTTNEPFYAGFVFLNPALLISFSLLGKKKRAQLRGKEMSLEFLCVACIALASFLAAFDGIYSGVNMRYFIDFSLLLTIPAIVCYWSGQELEADDKCGMELHACKNHVDSEQAALSRGKVSTAMLCLTLLGAYWYFLTFLSASHFGNLEWQSPEFYNLVKAMLFGS